MQYYVLIISYLLYFQITIIITYTFSGQPLSGYKCFTIIYFQSINETITTTLSLFLNYRTQDICICRQQKSPKQYLYYIMTVTFITIVTLKFFPHKFQIFIGLLCQQYLPILLPWSVQNNIILEKKIHSYLVLEFRCKFW